MFEAVKKKGRALQPDYLGYLEGYQDGYLLDSAAEAISSPPALPDRATDADDQVRRIRGKSAPDPKQPLDNLMSEMFMYGPDEDGKFPHDFPD